MYSKDNNKLCFRKLMIFSALNYIKFKVTKFFKGSDIYGILLLKIKAIIYRALSYNKDEEL
jgi:hypothetical protein